jgi:hypothetical protein
MRDRQYMPSVGRKLHENGPLENQERDGSITLRCILGKQAVRMECGWEWLRMVSEAGFGISAVDL